MIKNNFGDINNYNEIFLTGHIIWYQNWDTYTIKLDFDGNIYGKVNR